MATTAAATDLKEDAATVCATHYDDVADVVECFVFNVNLRNMYEKLQNVLRADYKVVQHKSFFTIFTLFLWYKTHSHTYCHIPVANFLFKFFSSYVFHFWNESILIPQTRNAIFNDIRGSLRSYVFPLKAKIWQEKNSNTVFFCY